MKDPILTNRSDFLWGVCMHTPGFLGTYNEGNLEDQVYLAAKMGCKLIRIDAYGTTLAHLDKAVKLANFYGMKVMLIVEIKGFERRIVERVEYTAPLNEYFRLFAERYNGKNGCGKIHFIQIHNEMDIWINIAQYGTTSPPNGDKITDWDETKLENVALHVKAAIDGVKAAKTDIKTVINFSWLHYGMLEYFQNHGVEWDVTGHDWYEDMMLSFERNYGKTVYDISEILYKKFNKPVLICESNLWKNSEFDNSDLSCWDTVVRCMEDSYNREYVIGYTFYELCDELRHDKNGWNREAHFGLILCNQNGEMLEKKPIYTRLQTIIGGKGGISKANWKTVSEKEISHLHIPM